ncbi:hypothetical protein FSP39_007307 [Pinctada imbricata]|uniref:CCHC-type domain-containing protein n=1 Tax=Pinctada imbricata TaxID=66713 RepID=A0AA88Y3M6_PINIB|nr:hypothetical protein FSP39_007307 [Pinctada imbricata]
MEYNLRPQWRQWTYATCQHPTCGRCGLSHAYDTCYAVNRQCFKCHNYGHYGRMCRTLPPTRESINIRTSKEKSSKKKVRDSLRLSSYLERKRIMLELPFSSLRFGSFRETVQNNNILKEELLNVKEKLVKSSALKQELQCALERERILEQKLSASENRNTELSVRLQSISQEKVQTQITENSKLTAEIADLRKQLEDKHKHCDYVLQYLCDTEASYERKLKEEKEISELQRQCHAKVEQNMVKKYEDLKASLERDIEILRQHRMNQNEPQGRPNGSNMYQTNQCHLSYTNPFRNHSRSSRNYRGRGRY